MAHSLSPKIFALLGRLLKLEVVYKAEEVPSSELGLTLERLGSRGYAGVNVTIPHKQKIIPYLKNLSPEAAAIGAVNAVSFSAGGLLGHNTDAAGFRDALSRRAVAVAGKDAVIFGAGGAARAVGFALGQEGARRVGFSARSPEKAAALAAALGKQFSKTAFSAGQAEAAELWVNATPLGMKGFPQSSPAPAALDCAFAFDLVYGPETPFLRQARAAGLGACGGLGMLVFQALRAWEFWFGALGDKKRMALGQEILKQLEI